MERRRSDIRVGHGHALGERGVSKTLGDGGSQKTVVLHRLVGKSEETEKDERANDSSPSSDFERVDDIQPLLQHDPGELEDAGVSRVGVSPGDPRGNTRRDAQDDNSDGYGDGEAEIDGSQSDETPVATVRQIYIGADEIVELLPPLHKSADGEGWVQEFQTGARSGERADKDLPP